MKDSLYRIGRLFYKDFKELGVAILILFPIFVVVSLIAFAFDFGFFTMIIGFILSVGYYYILNFMDKGKTIHYFMFPAKTVEKWCHFLLFSAFIVFMTALAVFFAAICVQFLSAEPVSDLFNPNHLLWESFSWNIMLLLAFLQALVAMLFIRFNEKWINISLILSLVIYVGGNLIIKIYFLLFEIFKFPYLRALLSFEEQFNGILYQEISSVFQISMIILIILLWITTYFGLREKQLEQ